MPDDVPWDELLDGEFLVSDDDGEMLWRQVSPSWLLDGDQVSSQAFRPTKKDEGRLSTSRASAQTPDGAYRFHRNTLGLDAVGVLGISVGEVSGAGSRAVDDSKAPTGPPPPCPPGHTYVDYRPFGSNRVKRIGATLLDAAVRRGWAHRPHET